MAQIVDHRGRPFERASTALAVRATLQEKALARRYLSLVKGGRLRASYDAAQTTPENSRHWINADALSADAAADPFTRAVVRYRSRYEVANNSYAKGIILTLANDTIGTGPRLQLLTPDRALNNRVEAAFGDWSEEIGLAEKLRTMKMARTCDGEVFGIMAENPSLDHEIKLDLSLVEADRVSSPLATAMRENQVDGVELDEWGNPVRYQVMRHHPGGTTWNWPNDNLKIEARDMIHAFRVDRPGQHRGVPEITSALPLFALLRRFTLAVASTAELSAEHAGVIETDQSPDDTAELSDEGYMEALEAERGMFPFLPFGWKAHAFQPAQPASTYAEFKHELINEIARCLNIPYNVAACNSSAYNYASGRLDHQVYFKSIHVDQTYWARACLDRLLGRWLWEMMLTEPDLIGLLPIAGPRRVAMPHVWFWDGTEHVDPVKEEKAREMRLSTKSSTMAREWAAQGLDWETDGVEQIAREVARCHELGIRHPSEAAAAGGASSDEDIEQIAEAVAELLVGAGR